MEIDEPAQAFYAKIDAHDTLLRLLVFEFQRRDPTFAGRLRKALDAALGMLAAQNFDSHPIMVDRRAKTREMVREILTTAEAAGAKLDKDLVSIRPTPLRHRFLNWLERGRIP
jgi:hypothetical protein